MTDSEEIKNTLSRFINSFDLKDWGPMANQLEPRVRIDYAYLRGDPLTEVGATEYLRSRSEAIHKGSVMDAPNTPSQCQPVILAACCYRNVKYRVI
jgi:hypothetical protein